MQTATKGAQRATQWAEIPQLAVECSPLDKQPRDPPGEPPYCLEFTTAVRALCHQWQVAPRVKYVPTGANPVDKLSCAGTSPYMPASQTPEMQALSTSSRSDLASALECNVVFVLVPTRELRRDLTSGFPLDEL